MRYASPAGGHAVVGSGGTDKVVDFNFSQMKVAYQPPAPPYPALAKIAGIQGTVVVELTVSPTGIVEFAHAIQGPPQLRAAAEAYAVQWQFQPAMLNGVAQRARFRLTMPFRLRGGSKTAVEKAVLEVTAPGVEFQGLVPALTAEAEAALKSIGVVLVDGASADDGKTHHLRIEVARPSYGGTGVIVSLRCCWLKDVLVAAKVTGKPDVLRHWAREIIPGPDAAASLRDEVREAVQSTVMLPPAQP